MIDLALGSAGADPHRNLALEEALLEVGRGGILLLYSNSPCLVIGRNQNPWAEVAESSGLPLLRRVSGGGAVYHDEGNLNWSLILPRRSHDRDAELALVAGALRALGVEAAAGPRGGLFISGSGTWAGAKISGTARRIAAERVLHHGTLLVDADLARMERSLGGMELESSRALSSVPAACVNLASVVEGIRPSDVAEALARALAGAAIQAAEGSADAAYAEEAELRLRGWEWTWGATPAFAVAVPWSGGIARIEIRKGRVAFVSGPGSDLMVGLIGRPFDYGLPRLCVEILNSGRVFWKFEP